MNRASRRSRATGARAALSLAILVAAACGGGSAPAAGDLAQAEVPEAGADVRGDPGDRGDAGDPAADPVIADLGDAADTPAGDEAVVGGCAASLLPYQCMPGVRSCGAGESCLGLESCIGDDCADDPCPRIPGQCLPVLPAPTPAQACRTSSDCAAGMVCALRDDPDLRGVCRPALYAGACWTDADCALTAATPVCAGASVCATGKACPWAEDTGVCAATAPAGTCWKDRDCGATEHCAGAVACRPGQAGCATAPGSCVAGALSGCATSADCAATPATPLCVGAVACPAGKTCVIPDARGACIAPTGLAGCVGDLQWCTNGAPITYGCTECTCHASHWCAPGATCGVDGFHLGFCSQLPADDDPTTLTVTVPAPVYGGVALWAAIRNEGAITAYVTPCPLSVWSQSRDNSKAWPADITQVHDPMLLPSCPPDSQGSTTPSPFLVLPPGSGIAWPVTFEQGVNPYPNAYRLVVRYRVGCTQDLPDSCAPNATGTQDRYAISADLDVTAPPDSSEAETPDP